jgi:hypothetical protein
MILDAMLAAPTNNFQRQLKVKRKENLLFMGDWR